MDMTLPSSRILSIANLEIRLRRLLHRWFVVYNPLYFASALSFLLGIYLGANELTRLDWQTGDLALLGILQAYELLLIGAAWRLWRAQAKRPAAILILLEMVFFFDPTCEVESMIHLEPWDVPLAGAWIVLALLKILALERIFGLRLGRWMWVAILGFTVTIVTAPMLLGAFPHAAKNLHPCFLLAVLCLGALPLAGRRGFALRDGRPPADTTRSCLHFALGAGMFLAHLHLVSWLYVFDLVPDWRHLAAYLVAGLFFLVLQRRYVVASILFLAGSLPAVAAGAANLEKAELAATLILAAFLLVATGLAIQARLAPMGGSARAEAGDGASEIP